MNRHRIGWIAWSIVLLLTANLAWAASNVDPAWKAFKSGNYPEALRLSKAVLDKDANSWQALDLIGLVNVHQGDSIQALEYFRRVLAKRADDTLAVRFAVDILLSDNKVSEARSIAQKAYEEDDGEPSLRLSRALVTAASDSAQEAALQIKQAIDEGKASVYAYQALARAYMYRRILALAIDALGEALKLDAENVDIRLEMANLMLSHRQFNDAMEQFRIITEKAPNNPDVWLPMGRVHFYASKFPEAETELKKATEFNPNSFEAWRTLAMTQRALRKAPDAQVSFEKASALRPAHYENRLQHAKNSFDVQQWEKTISLFRGLPPESTLTVDDLGRLGDAYINLGKQDTARRAALQDSALKVLKEVAARNAQAVRINLKIGTIYYQTDQYDSAIVYYQRELKLDSTNAGANINIGFSFLRLQKNDSSIIYLRKGIALDPTLKGPRLTSANLLLFMKKETEAIEEYKKLIELDSTLAEPPANIGVVLLNRKSYQSAIQYLDKATKLAPANDQYWVWLAQAYFYAEKYDAARKASRKALDANPGNKDAKEIIKSLEGR